MKVSALIAAALAAAFTSTVHANDRVPSGVQANKARAMADYWRHPTKPEVKQVESRTLTGKKSCELNIGPGTPAPDAATRPHGGDNNNVIIVREAMVNRC
jgi:hypothetical protein